MAEPPDPVRHPENHGWVLYEAYADALGWKSQGVKLPEWENLPILNMMAWQHAARTLLESHAATE
jgi:hypothetical protein